MRRRSRFTKHRHVGAIPPERRAISPRSPSFAATISSPSALTAETNSSRNASIDAATWSSTVPLPFRVASTSSAAPRLAASSQCAECEKPRPPRHDDTRSPLDAGSTSVGATELLFKSKRLRGAPARHPTTIRSARSRTRRQLSGYDRHREKRALSQARRVDQSRAERRVRESESRGTRRHTRAALEAGATRD